MGKQLSLQRKENNIRVHVIVILTKSTHFLITDIVLPMYYITPLSHYIEKSQICGYSLASCTVYRQALIEKSYYMLSSSKPLIEVWTA